MSIYLIFSRNSRFEFEAEQVSFAPKSTCRIGSVSQNLVRASANRIGGTITANGASMSFTSSVQAGSNRQNTAAGITVTTNAAGDITSLLGSLPPSSTATAAEAIWPR